jgi:carboxymethylenebutenolidase
MGETVSFASNGDQAGGYFAAAKAGSGPGVLVLQEWWGLAPQLKRVVDRLADEEGFTALAPDLYRGELAEHTEMDKAAALMNSLPIDRAARDMAGAIDYLLASPAVTSDRIGVIGFCMGGMLAMVIGAQQGDRVGGVATFYGAPLGDSAPDWTGLTAPVLGHFAMNDDFFPPDAVRDLEKQLKELGKDVSFEYIPDTGHAFANEDNPFGTHNPDAALKTWTHSVEWLRRQVG